jgi:hypothetical protein
VNAFASSPTTKFAAIVLLGKLLIMRACAIAAGLTLFAMAGLVSPRLSALGCYRRTTIDRGWPFPAYEPQTI